MEEPRLPRTLAEFPYVTVRISCMHCPEKRGRYRLARLAARFGGEASLYLVLFELTRSCKWQVAPETKQTKHMPCCQAYFLDLMHPGPPDELLHEGPPPHGAPRVALRKPELRLVSERGR